MLSTFKLMKQIHDRPGFVSLNDEQLHNLQDCIKGIAKDIFDIAKENNINMFLLFGNALGAVRHNDIIPWDDDIDVGIYRADYEKLISEISVRFQDKYWIRTPENTHQYGSVLAKIALKNTKVRQLEDFENDECGAFVDLFVIENAFDNVILRRIHCIGAFIFKGILSSRRMCRDIKYIFPLIQDEKKIKRSIRFVAAVGHLFGFLSLDTWTKLAVRWMRLCKNDHSQMVFIPAAGIGLSDPCYDRSIFGAGKDHTFGKYIWPIPDKAEQFLSLCFGSDYMTIPPISEREKHHFVEFNL